jgi:hypothetical protein
MAVVNGGEKALPVSWEMVALLLITLLAGILRFSLLTEIPPGLHFDEGFQGVSARAVIESRTPRIFFEDDMGEEPIAIHLVALAVALLGSAPWVIRLPSAIVGTLTVPLAWWLGRELIFLIGASSRRKTAMDHGSGPSLLPHPRAGITKLEAQAVGLGTALVLALLYWHVTFSRIGMEPILVPLFATLAFAALLRGLNLDLGQRTAYLTFVLAGLALGCSLYTYKAGYFVPVAAAFFVGYGVIVERGFLRLHWRGLLAMALVMAIVAMPLLVYFATHPENFMQRPASVFLSGADGPPSSSIVVAVESLGRSVVHNIPRVMGMFFWRGDTNPRSNLPGRPILDPFLAILFLVGLARSVAGLHRVAFALAPIWLGVMILPTLLTEHAPHFGRSIGAIPALALLCALGGWYLLFGIGSSPRILARFTNARLLLAGVLAVGLALSGFVTAWTYFGIWGRSPDLFYAYDVGLARLSDYMNDLPAGEDVYLTPTPGDHYTLEYLTHRSFSTFEGRSGLVLPPAGHPATYIVLLREDEITLPALQRLRPDGRIDRTWTDGHGQPYAVAYYLPEGASVSRPMPQYPAGATFGEAIRLIGYSVDTETVFPGETLHLTLYWESLGTVENDLTVFVHLLDGHNPATNGPVWAGHDGQPGGGGYSTSTWQPGESILDVHPVEVPPDTPAGEYQLEVGLYLLSTMVRLSATDASGMALPGDAVLLGTIAVEH